MKSETKSLFKPKDDQNVDDCLSHQIDTFDDIMNHKEDISFLVNKAKEDIDQ